MPTVPPQSFAARRGRALLPVGLGVVIAAAGCYLLAVGRQPTAAWVSLASGLVLALWFGQPLWRRAPVLWFDDAGLRARLPGFGCIAWPDIASVQLARVRGGRAAGPRARRGELAPSWQLGGASQR